MDELFNISLNSLQDSEPIEINEIITNQTETQETVEVVDTADGEQVVEVSDTTKAEEKIDTPSAKKKEEPQDLIDIQEIETDTTSEKEESETETPGAEDNSPITPFATLLQDQGFLSHANIEDIKSTEDLIKAFQAERDAYQKDIINSFPEELIAMAEAVTKGVPFEPLKNAKTKELQYSSITDDSLSENVNMQKQLVADYLTEKGFKPEKIAKYVEKYEDMGDLYDEAKDALVELKEVSAGKEAQIKEQYAAQQKQMEEKNKQLVADIEKRVTDVKEILPGRVISEDMKKRTLSNMLNIVGQDQNGNPMNGIMKARSTDPVAFDMNVAYMIELTNNFTDFSKINATAKTNAAKEFEKALATKSNTSHKSGTPKTLAVDGDIDPLEGLKYIK